MVQSICFLMLNKKNWKWSQGSALTVTVSINRTSMKSFQIGRSKQAANFEVRVVIKPYRKIVIIKLNLLNLAFTLASNI